MTHFDKVITALFSICLSCSAWTNPINFNLTHPHIPDELIVKFKNETLDRKKITESLNAKKIHRFSSSGAELLRFNIKDRSLYSIAKNLVTKDYIQYVEANYIVFTNETPNDPRFEETWGLHNTGENGNKKDADIDAAEAWNINKESKNTVVAVIDTGVDYTHEDIAENYWNNPGEVGLDQDGLDKKNNGKDDDENGYIDDWRGWNFIENNNNPMDDNGHGTHCSGTIAAVGDNNIGVAGVNWSGSVVGIKFLSASGSGTLANAVKSIEYATKLGVNLTSNSWGGGGHSPTMEAAIKEANKNGILFIAAAGNSASNNDENPHYPSNYQVENVISVAASDSEDKIAGFSNYGLQTVHLSAPGVGILSTTPGNQYQVFSGTSMATPHVAGAVALLKSTYKALDSKQIKERILNSVDHLTQLQNITITGGRLNLLNAIENDEISPNPVTGIDIISSNINSFIVRWEKSGDDKDKGEATRYIARISANEITDETLWEKSINVKMVKNEDKTYKIKKIPLNFSGYLSVRAVDNVGNISNLSKSIKIKTEPTQIKYANKGTLENLTFDPPWGIETTDQDRSNTALSDSPNGNYENDVNTTIQLPKFAAAFTDLILSFDILYALENRYDFAFCEISLDSGENWKQLWSVTGERSSWETIKLDIEPHLKPKNSRVDNFLIRFVLKSDYSISKEGIKIDNIYLLGKKTDSLISKKVRHLRF